MPVLHCVEVVTTVNDILASCATCAWQQCLPDHHGNYERARALAQEHSEAAR